MTRFACVAVGLLTMAGMAGCSAGSGPHPKPAAVGAAGKSITIGSTLLDPDNLTMSRDETLSFVSTATEPLTVEFTQPADQASRIKCAVADPKSLKPGETPWATFRANSQGHLTADMPPGQFPSTCKLAPGGYTYVVRPLNPAMRNAQNFLGQEGTITVK